MRNRNSEIVTMLAARDVERVRQYAQVVIEVSGDSIANIRFNETPCLGVLAVIGPGKFMGRDFKEAVLAEVGLGKTRPYQEAKKPLETLKSGEPRNIAYRRKWFYLSRDQYSAVAPMIFGILQWLVDERTAEWQCGPANPFFVPTRRHYFSRHQKKLFRGVVYKPVLAGLRFSVSFADEFFVRDIFWAELNLNRGLRRHLRGLARLIDLRLARYRNNGFSRRFDDLQGVKEVSRIISQSSLARSPYLLAEMLESLPRGKKNYLWAHLVGLLGVSSRPTEEKVLSSLALPNPASRLDKIQLRVIKQYTEYIVFEVYPRV